MPIYAYHCSVTKTGLIAYGCLCILLSVFSSCATIVSPTGGEKDTQAPRVIKRIPADSALQVRTGKWRIDFDEFIKLQDAQREIRITPLMPVNPKYSVHKNRLNIEIPDSVIQANTTYRIDFGNAVRDIHESNPAKDLHLTFSSGAYFDSLELSVQCIQAQYGLPDTDVLVMLYPANTPDSLLWVTTPMYVEKNTAKGCTFRNLPAVAFKLIALQDANNNYKRDARSDRIAFYTQTVEPGKDTQTIQLYTFSEVPANTQNQAKSAGRTKTKTPTALNYTVGVDTGNVTQRRFDLYDSLKLVFNRKPYQLDLKGFRLYGDSVLEAETSIEPTADSLTYFVRHQWQENMLYQLFFLNSFVSDTNRTFLPERLYRFRSKQNSDYGLIRLQVERQKGHIWQLVRNDTVVASQVANDTLLVFDHLLPAQYSIRCHFDDNQNGVWDNGSWPEKQLPERVLIISDRIPVKSNWENTLNMRNKTMN